MSSELITEKDIKNFEEQLKGVVQDRDRLRLVRTISHSFTFTSENIKRLVKIQHYGEPKIQTALLCYPACVDKQNFQTVVDEFYEEEKKQIKTQLNIK
eukprot:gene1208-1397_t